MKNISTILAFSVLLSIVIIPITIHPSYALQEIAGLIQVPINPGQTKAFQWGVASETDQSITVQLSADGQGSEFLLYPKSVTICPHQIAWINVNATMPPNYQGGITLTPAVYATQYSNDGTTGTYGTVIDFAVKKFVTLVIGTSNSTNVTSSLTPNSSTPCDTNPNSAPASIPTPNPSPTSTPTSNSQPTSSPTISNINGASLVIGQPDFESNTLTQNNISASLLGQPYGSRIDSSGNLWVADSYHNRVLEFTAPFHNGESASLVIGQPDFTTNINTLGTSNFLYSPLDIAFDQSRNLWVADYGNNRILKFTAPFHNGEDASLVIGHSDFTTYESTSVSTNSLAGPRSITFDQSGNLWVADSSNNRILKFTAPFHNGEDASLVIGQSDFVTNYQNNGGVSASSLYLPQGITFDQSGNLWVADQYNHRVLEYSNPSTNDQAASLVIGQPDFTTNSQNSGGMSASSLSATGDITIDTSGNLWVADYGNNRIVKFTTPFHNGESASLVIGQPDFVTTIDRTGIMSTGSFFNPEYITSDSAGNLWIDDIDNNRILEYTGVSSATTSVSATPSSPQPTVPITTESTTPTSQPSTSITTESTPPTLPPTTPIMAEPTISASIPSFVKSNAEEWSTDKITTSDFSSNIQFLMDQKIIKSPVTSETVSSQSIPGWVKGVAGWWSEGKLSDNDFVSVVQFLVDKNIIKS